MCLALPETSATPRKQSHGTRNRVRAGRPWRHSQFSRAPMPPLSVVARSTQRHRVWLNCSPCRSQKRSWGDSINERLTAAHRVAETEPRTLVCREPDHVLRLAGASDSSELRFQLGPNRLTSEDRLGMRPISTAYVAWIASR